MWPSASMAARICVLLLARMIGGDQMLAPVLDPFDRPAGISARRRRPERLPDKFRRGRRSRRRHGPRTAGRIRVSVQAFAPACRDSSAALWRRRAFPDVVRFVVTRDGAARFHRHAGMAADGKLKRNNRMRVAESGVDVAICLLRMTPGSVRQVVLVDARFARSRAALLGSGSMSSSTRSAASSARYADRPRRRPRPARRHSARRPSPAPAGGRARAS